MVFIHTVSDARNPSALVKEEYNYLYYPCLVHSGFDAKPIEGDWKDFNCCQLALELVS